MLENMQPPRIANCDSNTPYFISFKRNIQQILGKNCLFAVIPIFSRYFVPFIYLLTNFVLTNFVSISEGDGVFYPIIANNQAPVSDGNSSELENSETQLILLDVQ